MGHVPPGRELIARAIGRAPLWYGEVSDFPFRTGYSDPKGGNMTVDDRTRLNLHRKLDAVLGSDDADTLMAHLPPVTWQDVATKSDLHALESNLRAELRGEVRGAIGEAVERRIRWMVTFNTALAAVVLAAARLVF